MDRSLHLAVDRRVRNNILEYLELVASPARQWEYQRNVPIAHVAAEICCMWGDTVGDGPETLNPAVYSDEEMAAIRVFHGVWDATWRAMPSPLPTLSESEKHPAWRRLRDAAEVCLAVLRIRGRTPDVLQHQ
jgi:hypothetical protein